LKQLYYPVTSRRLSTDSPQDLQITKNEAKARPEGAKRRQIVRDFEPKGADKGRYPEIKKLVDNKDFAGATAKLAHIEGELTQVLLESTRRPVSR